MIDWFILLRGIALGLLLALMLVIALRFWAHYALRLLALFALCLCGYMLAPILHGVTLWFYLAVVFSDATVLLFLLLAQALFDDHRHPHRGALLFGAAYLSYSYVEMAVEHGLGIDTGLWRVPVRIAMVGGVTYALYVIGRNWRQDLVEARRRLRLGTIVVAGSYVLGVTLGEAFSDFAHIPAWVEVANSAGIVMTLLIFIAAALTLGTEGLLAEPVAAEPQASAPENPELVRIMAAMAEHHAYRDMELTIRNLAGSVAIPEHRLRRLINQQLGYRNFNDFLNHYRLQEVTVRLADAGQIQTPILTIAMDAGYRSMTTFNRAFRAAQGETPSAYRQKYSPISEKV